MLLLTLLLSVLSRPEFVPVGPDDVLRYGQHRAEFVHCKVPGPRPISSGDVLPGRYVVGCRAGGLAAMLGVVERAGVEVLRVDTVLGFAVVQAGAADVPGLMAASPAVRYVEPDCVVRAALVPNDPFFLQYQWDKWVMYSDKAWEIVTGATGIKVAIIDNGVDYNHPDLTGAFVPGSPGYDFVSNDNDPRPDNPGHPEAFHGTHVAGIVSAAIDNRIGIAGWAQVQLYAVKVLSDSGTGNTSALASGIRWAADNGCRVVNMSLGGSSAPTPLVEACQYAASRNVLLVAAAGNEGSQQVNFPAGLNECVAIGALARGSAVASFSNRGAQVELSAPGVDIPSTIPGGSFAFASGTSMAAPQVAGVAALLLALDPSLSAADVRGLLAASSVDMGAPGRDWDYGFGLVNARRALDLAVEVRLSALLRTERRSGPGLFGAMKLPKWTETVEVLDCAGRVVERRGPGEAVGAGLPPGVYLVRLLGSGRSEAARLVRVR